jgi:WD40 repeat protein
MSEPLPIPENPYVGPRPFTHSDPLFGRDVEKIELLNVLIAERIVLLYSPSGAGKTSLIQAGLVPDLEAEHFRPLPPIRVNRMPSDDISPNRYVASAIDSLNRGPDGQAKFPAPELAGLSLDGYLARLEADDQPASGDAADPFVLIFDQFEEILTADPADLAVKEEFFAQVGAALLPRHRWALFAMREEHVAALDPYLRHIPTRLATTFRLGLLGHPAAKEAIQRPAAEKHVAFTGPAADALIADLSAVKRPDGTVQAGALPFVEPVQLQVVCRQFWGSLPWAELPVRDGQPQIAVEHITQHARVDDALAAYYADKVADIAEVEGGDAPVALERQIREWIETNLITERGTRAQLRVGAEREQTLPGGAIKGLADAYLIRSEGRPDDRWYELAHDRLVQPVRDNNAAWLSEHLHKVQARARQWDQSGRHPETLPRGAELRESEAWVAANAPVLSAWEQRLMADYVAAGQREHGRRRWRIAAVVAGLLALVLVPAALVYSRGEGERKAIEATVVAAATSVAIESLTQRNETLTSSILSVRSGDSLDDGVVDRALLLAVQAVAADPALEARRALLRALTAQPGLVAILPNGPVAALDQQPGLAPGAPAAPAAMAISADGSTAAAVRCTRQALACSASEITLWDVGSRRVLATIPAEEVGGAVQSLALNPDGRTLAVGSAGRGVTLRDVQSGAAPGNAFGPGGPGAFRVSSLAYSPDGNVLAAGGERGDIALWNRDRLGAAPAMLTGQSNTVTSLAFNQDGMLASGDTSGAVVVWDDGQPVLRCVAADGAGRERCEPFQPAGTPTAMPAGPFGAAAPAPRVSSVAFGGDGEWLAAGREDGSISVWDITGSRQGQSIPADTQQSAVIGVGFAPDSPVLSAVTTERIVLPWNVENGRPASGATNLSLTAAALAGDGSTVVTGDARGTIVLWDLTLPSPLAQRIDAEDIGPVLGVAIAKDGQTLAVAGSSSVIWLLVPGDGAAPALLADLETESPPSRVALSADGRWLAAGGSVLPVWDIVDRAAPVQVWSGGEYGDFVSVALSPDGEWLAAGDDQARVLVWQLDNLDADPGVLIGHVRFVEAVAFSPDSQTLASGGAEGLVRLWNLADLAATPVSLDDPRSTVRSVRAVAFGPDGPNGPKLAAADATGGVDVWDADAAQFAYSLPLSQPPGAFAVAFGSDGVLAAAMSDASILLWDAQTNLELGRLPLLAQPVSTLSFAEDGTLASGGATGSNDDPPVLLWSLSVDAMQQVACRVANRGLTAEEKQQFMPDPSAYAPVCETVLAGDTAPAAAPAGTPVATPS